MISRFLASAAIACSAAPAFGHAFLNHADPGAGATLKVAPARLVLVFSERLEGAFSGVAVVDGAGRSVEAAPAVTRGNSIVVALRPLAAGKYRVMWHAVSVDTHRTEGAYSFAVKP
jgi:methionine-rich copper-binding protein CopC